MKTLKKMVLLPLCLLSFLGKAQNKALFEQGKEQYKAESYQEAINSWSKILQGGEHSAALYFNMGNAYYKLNQVGPSIYYYEKALQMAPHNSDIQHNLAFAQNATVDAIEPLPKTFFAKWNEKISGLMGYDGWAWFSVGAVFLFAFCFLNYYFGVQSQRKRLFFAGSLVSFLVLMGAFFMAFRTFHSFQNNREGIVFATVCEVKSGPRMKEATTFKLHEGTKVTILAEEDNWYRISLADGKDGWLPEGDLKEL
ncbi:MAG TPA: tetratricopeptide repeat protein [Flavobacteriaceae bacterium]|nr:tetratricopeptide repeat protein [Flavobacteriaceae bacterium]MCB9212763.1 tetratricopeptide repeat protein [Alteromonas sp.]HPF10071.1 tetratricopeptide repeat protein [Flavobacteriaceae bacterium]HQU21370.1 tetratricopeptide repeat protein [Flavobacteriaceae bacterium]HQU63846.1 tetratricopeptide repeat protein [Flavobacteriaceae bacterium]